MPCAVQWCTGWGERTSKWNKKWRYKYCTKYISGGTSSSSMQLATRVSLVTAGRNAVRGTAAAAVSRMRRPRRQLRLMRRIGEHGSNYSANYKFKQWISDVYRETFKTLPLKNQQIAIRTTTNHVTTNHVESPKGKQWVGTEWTRQWRRWEHMIKARRNTAVPQDGELEERRGAPTEETPA